MVSNKSTVIPKLSKSGSSLNDGDLMSTIAPLNITNGIPTEIHDQNILFVLLKSFSAAFQHI